MSTDPQSAAGPRRGFLAALLEQSPLDLPILGRTLWHAAVVGFAAYARSIADRYLARCGLTYDSWMAAVDRDAHPVMVARATEIERDLRKVARDMRARLRRTR